MKKFLTILAFLAASAFAKAQNHSVSIAVTATSSTTAPGCTSTTPCQVLIYRKTGTCDPTITTSTLANYTKLNTGTLGTATTTGETFTFTDADTALTTGQTYCWAATVQFLSGGGESAPTATGFQLTIIEASPAQPVSVTGKQTS